MKKFKPFFSEIILVSLFLISIACYSLSFISANTLWLEWIAFVLFAIDWLFALFEMVKKPI